MRKLNRFLQRYLIGSLVLIGACTLPKNNPLDGKKLLPSITTIRPSSITQTSAQSGGVITAIGTSQIVSRGLCWSPDFNFANGLHTIPDSGISSGSFTIYIIGLQPGTKYYIKSYATNYYGTNYGDVDSFITEGVLPVITTTTVSNITSSSAISGGNITSTGGIQVIAKGVCWATSINPTTALATKTIDTGSSSFSSDIAGLTPNTIYYVRAYATNSIGTAYGNQVTFTTNPVSASIATISTLPASSITQTTAQTGGNILNDGGAAITSKGVCWSTGSTPNVTLTTKTVDGAGSTNFSSNISGLSPNTAYFVRAYATNSAGTAYGNVQTFTTATLTVGMSYQGGKIAYILQPGDPGYDAVTLHGLIAAPSDQSSGVNWAPASTWVGGTFPYIGTGQANTMAIVDSFTSGAAANLCNDLILGGYSDWYLPSVDELNKLYINRVAIGNFAVAIYWSSTEYNSTRAWEQLFTDGSNDTVSKAFTFNVRAIRSF